MNREAEGEDNFGSLRDRKKSAWRALGWVLRGPEALGLLGWNKVTETGDTRSVAGLGGSYFTHQVLR